MNSNENLKNYYYLIKTYNVNRFGLIDLDLGLSKSF